jgi:hypothetical protein
MSWIVSVDDEFVKIPFGVEWSVPDLEGVFPDQIVLTMDEQRFKHSFAKRALWVQGKGNYVSISYCPAGGPTSSVIRHLSRRSHPSV